MGNCKTAIIERTLRANLRAIADFASDRERIVLELFD
jgi:predicted nuclease of predicted toxin-antitoxin system